jgi:hypothetical protein
MGIAPVTEKQIRVALDELRAGAEDDKIRLEGYEVQRRMVMAAPNDLVEKMEYIQGYIEPYEKEVREDLQEHEVGRRTTSQLFIYN